MEVEILNSTSLARSKGETCIICDKEKTIGIHLYTSFICVECENEITSTQTSDEKYKFFLEKLRRVKNPPLYS
ncbi:sigma factor G inhibitor Gin [Metabacillus litoralis]|uniref:sigma factor G inhibitor Gin n=1 Tax=Metabacillus litoralis TaxID=152268 RepID=UPI001CFE64BC|nr:sigma factor G inhibitor Gin [Metabacillus litoralis]